MAETRPIAMGVAAIRIADYGDGVPGTSFTKLPAPAKGAVAFNFSDPKEVNIPIEGTTKPLYVTFVKDGTDYIEFSIPTPSNATIALLMGGNHQKGTSTNPKDAWEEGMGVADINKTFQMETPVRNGSKVIYTIVNGKIAAKLAEAPRDEQAETLLVRVYKQAAITSAGVEKTAFIREVIKV